MNTVVKVIQGEAFLDSSPDLPEIGVVSSGDLEIDRPVTRPIAVDHNNGFYIMLRSWVRERREPLPLKGISMKGA